MNRNIIQYVVLMGCDLKRSMSSVKFKSFLLDQCHLPISTNMKFHRNLVSSFFSGTIFQSLTGRCPEIKKEDKRNNVTNVDTL